tara:strand:- start:316115 stop:316261 length:147 start_codon:yes stop_codon:yes gene_type:complete
MTPDQPDPSEGKASVGAFKITDAIAQVVSLSFGVLEVQVAFTDCIVRV